MPNTELTNSVPANWQKQPPEMFFETKLFSKTSQFSQKSTCVVASFYNVVDLQTCNFIIVRLQDRCFPIAKFSQNTYFEEHLRADTSEFTFRSDCLYLYFFEQSLSKPSLLKKYWSLSNQSFKHSSLYAVFIHLTPTLPFEPRFHMFITDSYYRKSKRL